MFKFWPLLAFLSIVASQGAFSLGSEETCQVLLDPAFKSREPFYLNLIRLGQGVHGKFPRPTVVNSEFREFIHQNPTLPASERGFLLEEIAANLRFARGSKYRDQVGRAYEWLIKAYLPESADFLERSRLMGPTAAFEAYLRRVVEMHDPGAGDLKIHELRAIINELREILKNVSGRPTDARAVFVYGRIANGFERDDSRLHLAGPITNTIFTQNGRIKDQGVLQYLASDRGARAIGVLELVSLVSIPVSPDIKVIDTRFLLRLVTTTYRQPFALKVTDRSVEICYVPAKTIDEEWSHKLRFFSEAKTEQLAVRVGVPICQELNW